MASLSRIATRFRRTFPTVKVDDRQLDRALEAFDARKIAPMKRLTNLAGALLLEPPVDDLAVPFAHELLVAAVRRMGARGTEAETHAAAIVEGIAGLGDSPLFGLHISIGAPRRGVPITMLSYLDKVIECIHARLTEALAHPVGPQEHANGHPRHDNMPSDQWEGHVTDYCVPAHRHDALLVLPGRSIGVGESLAIAGTLLVPVFALEMPVPTQDSTEENGASEVVRLESADQSMSCRLEDGEIATRILTAAATAAEVADHVVLELTAAAPQIRQHQRTRVRYLLEVGEYRAYLAGRGTMSTASAATRRRVGDPFEFASLTELQRDKLAAELDAMTRGDHNLLNLLGPEALEGFRAFLSSMDAPSCASGILLRAGLREMARFADEPLKAARPYVWDEDGWRRLWANLGQP